MEDQNKNKNFSPSAPASDEGQSDDYLLDSELEKDLEIGNFSDVKEDNSGEKEVREKRKVRPVTEEDIEKRIDSLADEALSSFSSVPEEEKSFSTVDENKDIENKNEGKQNREDRLEEAEEKSEEKKEEPEKEGKIEKAEEEWKKFFRAQIWKMQNELQQMLDFLEKGANSDPLAKGKTLAENLKLKNERQEQGKKIIEGVFTGEEMVGPDGKHYSVPSNYASKSKLVEGDILKLIIEPDGTFIYKQIGPVKRERIVGTLIKNENSNQFYILADGRRWRLLRAAVTYFNGRPGDEVIALVPDGSTSEFAAVENIVRAKG